jgi:hypothetical protein
MVRTRADQVVAAATAAIGRPLTEPVVLADADWTLVLRCADTLSGNAVVVKGYPATPAGAGCFAAEVSGLELAGDSGLTPRVLAVAPAALTVVMSDLGSGPSLADVLLGDSPEAAATALFDWAAGCGQLSAFNHGRRAEFNEILARYLAGRDEMRHITGLAARVLGVPEEAAGLGVDAPAGLTAELTAVADAVRSGGPAVFSPGDICPDNNVLTSAGIRFLDFEEAGFHSVFLDVAYIRMPFATCWCVFRLPGELADAAESAYRRQLTGTWPALADDAAWQAGVRLGVAAWTLSATSWLLRRSLRGNAPMHPERTSPRTRTLMRFRWQSLGGSLEREGQLPAVAELMRRLLTATESWEAGDLPVYPAFRPR